MFRRITRAGTLGKQPLSAEAFRLILRARAEEAGYDLARITPHSLRAGCTALAQASVHERDIMKHARHGSQSGGAAISAPPPPRRRSPQAPSGAARTRRGTGA